MVPGLCDRSALSSLLRPDQLDELGRAKVNQFLQLEGDEKVFAIGDCCNTQEDKMAAFADKHGEVVAANIISQARGCPLTPYKRVGKLKNQKYFLSQSSLTSNTISIILEFSNSFHFFLFYREI